MDLFAAHPFFFISILSQFGLYDLLPHCIQIFLGAVVEPDSLFSHTALDTIFPLCLGFWDREAVGLQVLGCTQHQELSIFGRTLWFDE